MQDHSQHLNGNLDIIQDKNKQKYVKPVEKLRIFAKHALRI